MNDYTIDRRRPSGITYTRAAIASDDLYGYLAASKEAQPKLQSILAKYGYDQADTETDLAHKISSLVMNVGESALKDIAMIHPDKELILSLASPVRRTNIEFDDTSNDRGGRKSKSHNDCGCGGSHNASGESHNDCGCGGSHNASGSKNYNDCGCGGNKHVAPTVSMNDTGSSQFFSLEPAPAINMFDSQMKSFAPQNPYLLPAVVLSASILVAVVIWKKL